MRSYETARNVIGFFEFVAWCVVAIGVLLILIGFGAGGSFGRSFGAGSSFAGALTAGIPGIAITLLGILAVVQCQTGRAGVDTAEYNQQMLKVARDTLEVSRQTLRQNGAGASPSFSAAPQTERVEPPLTSDASLASAKVSKPNRALPDAQSAQPISYNGVTIAVENGTYRYAGLMFHDLEKAKAYADQLGVNENASPEPVPQIASPNETIEYRGVEVIKRDNKFLVGERMFYSEHAAQKYVDRTLA